MKWVIFWAVGAVLTAGYAMGQTPAVTKQSQGPKRVTNIQPPASGGSAYQTPAPLAAPMPNLFIGTGGHGHTHPSAQRPFGMVQLGPDTRLEGWDGCSGYHYTDTALYGFSHTHLSGTGVSDYGDLLVLPQSGPLQTSYRPVPFQHASANDYLAEIAEPGYYSVQLPGGIRAEFTASERVGRHRYWANPSQSLRVLVRMQHRDKAYEYALTSTGTQTATGRRFSRAWATHQKLFFALQTSVPYTLSEPEPGLYALEFAPGSWARDGFVTLDVALSSTDEAGALRNLQTEVKREPTFDRTRAASADEWQRELGKIEVHGTPDQEVIFRTALYHCFSVPNLWSDVDGRYRGMDDAVHRDTVHARYTVFSLWDTYRTAHPLYALTQPERTEAFIATMLDHFAQSGRLPVWELAANETNCMIGYHAVSVIADAYAKGYRGFSLEAALRAADSTANASVFGLPAYRKNGFLSVEDAPESVSKTLEYAYDDWCIAQLARAAGNKPLTDEYLRRATGYRSVVDPETGLMRPRVNGGWLTPFEPREVNNHFTEANSWQYSFAPVHDLAGWTAQLGNGDRRAGTQKLELLLDQLFTAPKATVGRDQADITGLIGQYAHGNEPSHHIAFLYNATASPWKGQNRVKQVLDSLYRNAPDGLSGNEDCGQMSAWYVMASLGLYPLVPGEDRYATGSFYWERATLHLPDGLPGVSGGSKRLDLVRTGEGPYVRHLRLNGKEYGAWVDHAALLKGGMLEFEQVPMPEDRDGWEPYANGIPSAKGALPAPSIDVARSFSDRTSLIVRQDAKSGGYPYVSRNGGPFQPFTEPATLTESAVIRAASMQPDGTLGHIATATTTRWPNTYTVTYSSAPNRQYTGVGANALVDGIEGDVEWRKGHWVGHQGVDLWIQVDLGKKRKVSQVSVGVLKDIGAWIAFPETVELWTSNRAWANLGEPTTPSAQKATVPNAKTDTPPERRTLKLEMKPTKARFLYVKLTNAGPLPEWHPGAGGQTFFFLDEISVE